MDKKRKQLGRTRDDMPEMLSFIIDHMATKEDLDKVTSRVTNIEQNVATKRDLAEFKFSTEANFAEVRERLTVVEKGQHDILDIVEPLSKAFDLQVQMVVKHERQLTETRRYVSKIQQTLGMVR